jgi:hypothetical protein
MFRPCSRRRRRAERGPVGVAGEGHVAGTIPRQHADTPARAPRSGIVRWPRLRRPLSRRTGSVRGAGARAGQPEADGRSGRQRIPSPAACHRRSVRRGPRMHGHGRPPLDDWAREPRRHPSCVQARSLQAVQCGLGGPRGLEGSCAGRSAPARLDATGRRCSLPERQDG